MKDREGRNNKIAVYIISAVIIIAMILLIIFVIRDDPKSFETALTCICIVISSIGLISILGILYSRKANKFKELKNIENITQQMNAMVILWDSSFSYIRVNDEFIRKTGYTAEDLDDPEVFVNILPPEAFYDNLQSIINSRDKEYFIRTKKGSSICTVWNTSIVSSISISGTELPVLMSIGPDVTESQRLRQDVVKYSEKLRESEKRYELSMALSEIGLLLMESSTGFFYVSDQLCKMLGIESKNGYIERDVLRGLVHPQDKAVFDSFAYGAQADGDKTEHGDIHYVDFRALSADGEYHWYNFRYQTPKTANLIMGGALMDITDEKEKDLVIERMAYIDEVTQIFNRNRFMMLGDEILRRTKDDKTLSYWVIVFDIDSFHILNDTCGYATGSRLLKEIASILILHKDVDDVAARIGGDNFALLIKGNGTEEQPETVIKSVQKEMAHISGIVGLENQHITCSAGYCLMDSNDSDSDFAHVLDHAEFALSLSDGTRGNVIRFDSRAHDTIIAGNAIEKDLTKAIGNNELKLYYQPKISLIDGSVMGMEALIRWIKPNGTIIPPCDFIPVAERSMLITRISKFVMKEACRQNKEWQDKGLAPVTVSINLTAIDFYQTNVTESIRETLAETGLDPQWLDVELTESLALKDIDHAVQQMQEIKDIGVKLSMDDFGTGYSSLSYIQILPITLLKLDRSFIMYLEEDEISREIVSAVIRIAKSKKIETIAEGIETVGQGEILKASGCDYAQGYFFGKPMPADKFEEFLRERQPVRDKLPSETE